MPRQASDLKPSIAKVSSAQKDTSQSPTQITDTKSRAKYNCCLKPLYLGDICYTAADNWCTGKAHESKAQFMRTEAAGREAIESLPAILLISLWEYAAVLTAVYPFSPHHSFSPLPQPQMVTPAPTQHDLSVQELTITK